MIHYPHYHPNRSRYFNTVTLFVKAVSAIQYGTQSFFNLKQIQWINVQYLCFMNYVNWEESGGKELQLPGFFLTNRQMYWLVSAHVSFVKHHPHKNLQLSTNFYLYLENFHIHFKSNLHFRESYNCSEMTEDEEKRKMIYFKESYEGSLRKVVVNVRA